MTTVNTLCLKLGRQEVLRRARQRIKTFAFNFFCLSLFFLPFKCQKHEIIKDWCPNGISFNLINQIRFVLDRNKDRIRIGPKLKLSSSSCGFETPGSGGKSSSGSWNQFLVQQVKFWYLWAASIKVLVKVLVGLEHQVLVAATEQWILVPTRAETLARTHYNCIGLQYTSACKAQYNVQRTIYVHANSTIYGGTIHHIVQKLCHS